MKPFLPKLFFVTIFCVLLCGCSSGSPEKIDDDLLNHFSSKERSILKEANPDLVTMHYLVDHSSDYATDIDSERNDFFVVVKGTVTKLETEEYDDDILDKMDPEMADLLRGKTSTDIYLDKCDIPLNDSDSEYSIKVGKEYYFYVTVSEKSNGDYRYTLFNCFDFN